MEYIRYFFEQSAGQRRLRELKPNQCGSLILGERHALCVPIYAQTEKIAYLLLSCTQWHIPDMDVIALTDEQREAFKDASASVYDEYRDKIGGDLLDAVVAACAK